MTDVESLRVAGAIFLALLAATALSGCQSTAPPPPIILAAPPIKPQPLADRIPASTLQCAREPDSSKVVTVIEVARAIDTLRAAGRDCRRKLGAVKAIIEGERSPQ